MRVDYDDCVVCIKNIPCMLCDRITFSLFSYNGVVLSRCGERGLRILGCNCNLVMPTFLISFVGTIKKYEDNYRFI